MQGLIGQFKEILKKEKEDSLKHYIFHIISKKLNWIINILTQWVRLLTYIFVSYLHTQGFSLLWRTFYLNRPCSISNSLMSENRYDLTVFKILFYFNYYIYKATTAFATLAFEWPRLSSSSWATSDCISIIKVFMKYRIWWN